MLRRILMCCGAGLLWSNPAAAFPTHYAQCSLEQGYGLSLAEPAPTSFHGRLDSEPSGFWSVAASAHTPIPWTKPIGEADARQAMAEMERLQAEGRPHDALLQLRVVAAAYPRLADRLAQLEGDLLLLTDQPQAACDAFLKAAESLDRNVAARARVGYVRCGFAMGARDAEARLTRLLQRYPELPDRQPLRLLLADYEVDHGRVSRAIALYRSIDLDGPASQSALVARIALEALANQGMTVRALSPLEETDRAERLVRSGPIDEAHATVDRLLARESFPAKERARLQLMAARMARIEGRWEEAAQAVQKARALGMVGPESDRLLPPQSPAHKLDDPEQAQAAGLLAVKQITRGRPVKRLTNAQVILVLRTATQYGLSDVASEAVEAMAARSKLHPAARFDAALSAIGVASDASLATLLKTLIDVPRYRVDARYHYGRALERGGKLEEALAVYRKVVELDHSTTPYYSLWAEQRLQTLLGTKGDDRVDCVQIPGTVKKCLDSASLLTQAALADSKEDTPSAEADPELRQKVLRVLAPLAQTHDEAYPWLSRAADLVRLDRYSEAADELNEAYLALRDAQGAARLRSGLESVFTGDAPPRRAETYNVRRARLALSRPERERLSNLSALLGDHGIALRFAGYKADERPRAYATEVDRAASRFGVDPDLLFAVMRVESIYNRRIISHVGAIGLTQIMPRTGRLIANSLDIPDFDVTDLLDPQTNLNFSAWYLSSLLRRFEGHLPLAIAAYNGGPHNVRLWLRRSPESMPLDAFLEHIPFSQTHRYVRRVLTHYAAYRAQRSLPMPHLSVNLPKATPDAMAF